MLVYLSLISWFLYRYTGGNQFEFSFHNLLPRSTSRIINLIAILSVIGGGGGGGGELIDKRYVTAGVRGVVAKRYEGRIKFIGKKRYVTSPNWQIKIN